MRKTLKKIILVPLGAQKKIAERVGVHPNTVSIALRFADNGSDNCNLIRSVAVKEFGGKVTTLFQ